MSRILEDMRRETAEKAAKQAAERTTEQLTVTHLVDIMRKLSYTAEQAMDLLDVPESKWEAYAALVGDRVR